MNSSSRFRLTRSRRSTRNSKSRPGLEIWQWLSSMGVLTVLCLLVTILIWRRTDALVTFSLRASERTIEWPLLHIVHTRFQQDQPHLLFLGRARLLLFKTFCLPTMISQTSQQFLWIIHTDPKLHHDLLAELRAMLRPYPHFYLIGSNVNMNLDSESSWKDDKQGKIILQSPIHSGDVTLLRQAYVMRHSRPLLETRLDADDGLHSEFLEYLQTCATKRFATPQTWMYWCSRRHLEWFPGDELQPVEHSKLCISAGITVGYNIGTSIVPHYPHDVLYKSLVPGQCGVDNCIELVNEFPFCAIRSRTLTSAGMKDLSPTRIWPKAQLWNLIHDKFHIESTSDVQAYMRDHLVEIAKDNLSGQCTSGHSCKLQAKEDLQRLIELKGILLDVVTQ